MKQPSTAHNWNALMKEWERSGETQEAFCRRKGIKFITFRNRRYELMRDAKQTNLPGQLLPVRIAEATVASPVSEPDLFLQFPGGACLRFVVGTSVDYLSRLTVAMGRQTC